MTNSEEHESDRMWDVVSVGESMALMREGIRSGDTSCFQLGYGGAESNVLTQASRLGLRAKWFSSVGEDMFGSMITNGLKNEGVALELIPANSRPTGLMVKTYGERPDPDVEYFRSFSAATQIKSSQLDFDSLLNAKMIHMTGIFPAISQQAANTAKEILSEATKRGTPVSLDVNYRKRLWGKPEASEFLKQIWKSASYVFGDRAELLLLVDGSTPYSDEELLSILSSDGRTALLKRGAEGASAMVDGKYFEVPAATVDVIDTVGAGDAFVGGFLSAVVRKHKTKDALRVAALCGAAACESPGDWEGQLTESELEEKIKGEINW